MMPAAGARPAAQIGLAPVQPRPEPWLPVAPAPPLPDAEAVEALVATAHARLSAAQQRDPFAVIDACVAAEMGARGTPGASLAIAVDGVITYTRGYGVKHLENGGAIGPDTVFRIGSTTKMMTAAALMTLVDGGDVDLDEPITTYVPDLRLPDPWDAASLTSRHLLTHSAGLPDSYGVYDEASFANMSLEQWAYEVLPYTPLHNPPGAFWNYSNPSFSLAGMVVQEMSGQLAVDYIEDEVWERVGMAHTTFDGQAVIRQGDFAFGHHDAERLTPDRWSMPALAPAGTAFSTATDMVTWALTLADGGGAVLSPAAAEAMQARQIDLGYHNDTYYGFGVFVNDFADVDDPEQLVPVFHHGGNLQGFSSQLYWVPERGVAVSILANTMESLSGSAACVLRELARVAPRQMPEQTTDPAGWGLYEGVYAMVNQVGWDFTARVERVRERLVLSQLDLGGALPLVQVLRDTFLIDADEDGQPDAATAGLDFTFIRDRDDPDRVPWLRSRIQVGQRVARLPAAVAVRGASCGLLEGTADLDMPQLRVRASGLVPAGGQVLTGLPIVPSDPADPSSASYKHDLQVRGEAGLFLAVVIPQAGDNLELYLLVDRDGDGLFDFEDELVAVGLPGSPNIRALLLPGRLPSGRYQLWVHGTYVQGEDHTFTMQLHVVDGEHLSVADAPTSLAAGDPIAVRVCADDVADLRGPHQGFVELDYGSPPRRARIPVLWQPAAEPGGATAYLPLANR